MKIETITGSTAPAVSLDELKDWLRLERGYTHDDALLDSMGKAAENRCEEYLGRKITPQTLMVWHNNWPDKLTYPWRSVTSPNSMRIGLQTAFQMPFPPFRGLTSTSTSIVFYDEDGTTGTPNSTTYFQSLVSNPGLVGIRNDERWPTTTLRDWDAISIQFACGYSSSAPIPDQIKTAVKIYVGDLYEHREVTIIGQGLTVVQLPYQVENMLRPFKSWHGAV